MVVFPHCKINLGLNVLSSRADGYHNIETCFYPVALTDILEIIPSPQFSFTQSGLVIPGAAEENLCVKAYRLLKKSFDIGYVKIHLHKVIPTGGGLGGGSSNGAFTLQLLNRIFALKLSEPEINNWASQIGSDCTFFTQAKARIGKGRGEELHPTPVSLKNYFLVLVIPPVHVSTAEAYAGIALTKPKNTIEEILEMPMSRWKDRLINDFEKSVFTKYPVIGALKEKMYSLGATYASMSGSGASVYGIFEKPIELKDELTGLFYWSGELK
ncbi:MAG: 4-(cytidine 5'-diphospho)-2-C-methyl-D-erythritol kinase [Bacteroidetes bacterium]|nr:4-(cytidine 5'-diphospho)-2-C-methyl-D-erythritol kinase [Bacteroidota bacterium]